MKLFLTLMSFLLLAALVGPFFLRGPDGQPLMKVADVVSTPEMLREPVAVHRWQDEHGVWQFGEKPPETGLSEMLHVDAEASLTPMGREWNVERLVAGGGQQGGVSVAMPTNVLDVYTKGPELVEQAQAAADALNERYADMPR